MSLLDEIRHESAASRKKPNAADPGILVDEEPVEPSDVPPR